MRRTGRPLVFVTSAGRVSEDWSEARDHLVHVFLTAARLLGTIPRDWKRGPVVPNSKGRGTGRTATTIAAIHG